MNVNFLRLEKRSYGPRRALQTAPKRLADVHLLLSLLDVVSDSTGSSSSSPLVVHFQGPGGS